MNAYHHPPAIDFALMDELGQPTATMAVCSIAGVARREGRMMFVGDSEQLPPTVVSKRAKGLGLGISIFARILDSLGHQEGAVVFLDVVYRAHPRHLHLAVHCVLRATPHLRPGRPRG